jgi:hypothetical protein
MMRKLRLLTKMIIPGGELPAGAEITVDAAEAARLLAARGLAEDLGEAEPDSSRAASGGAALPPDGAATGGEGETLAATNPEAEVAASNSDQANGEDAPAQEADKPAAASATAQRQRKKV